MLKTYAAFFSLLQSLVDIAVIGGCWVVVYFLRFHSGIFGVEKGIPEFNKHLLLLIPVIFIGYLGCLISGLYKSKRTQNMLIQLATLLKTSLLSVLFIVVFFYYVKDEPYSRKLFVLFTILLFFGLSFSHVLVMNFLRLLRKRGYNQRFYAIIGANHKGQTLVEDVRSMPWAGLRCSFFIDNVAEGRRMTREEVNVVGKGRIWTGKQAKERGLVDELGGMNKAIDILKNLANIDKDVEVVVYPQAKPSFTISLDFDLSGMKTDALPEEIRNIVEIIKDANFYILFMVEMK